MKIAARIVVGLALLLVLAVLALALALPPLARSDAVRERIESAARDATGREVRFETLELGFLPPRLVVVAPQLADEQGTPLFQARSVALEMALVPLLRRVVVIDSLRLDGATARLTRTQDGIEHPFRAERPAETEREESDSSEPRDADSGFALAVREIGLRDARVLLEDRVVSPPVTWDLREVDATARGDFVERSIDFQGSGAVASGGRLRAKGRAEPDGSYQVDLDLASLQLDAATPYLSAGQRAAGAASGSVTLVGAAELPGLVSVDLTIDDGELRVDEMAVRGRFALQADLSGEGAHRRGSFQVDATEAEIDYGSAFRKARGQAATATGRIVSGKGGLDLEDTKVRIKNFEADVHLETGARTRATISAPPFEVAELTDLLPGLRDLAASGPLALAPLRVATAPLELGGRIDAPDLRLRRADGLEVRIRGAFEGERDGLRSRDLVAELAEQAFPLVARLQGLAGSPRFAVQVDAENVDSAALLHALARGRQGLEGPLRLHGSLDGPIGGSADLLASLRGKLRMDIAPGRLAGVSLLRDTFGGLGSAGDAALLAGRLEGGRTLQRFYEDEFESLGATLQIAEGLARTDDLRLVYRHYTVELRGAVGLADRSLDLKGRLTIDEAIDEAIAHDQAPEQPASGGRRRVIPLARVTGTLDAPRVTLTSDDALRFAAIYTTERHREKWERKLDKKLGEGSGRQVLDILDGILREEGR